MLLPLLAALLTADPTPPLVSTAWLAQRLGDKALVILHVGDQRSRPLYDQGHIPGAVFINPFVELAAPPAPGGLTLELPSAAQLDSVLDTKGISNTATVVVVSAQEYFTPTARTFFTLEYAGLRGQVMMLDGGLEAWKREGRPLSTESPTPTRGDFTPDLQSDLVVDAAWVATRLDRPSVAIVDARAPAFYNGAEARQARVGRIPGAGNLPFNTVVAADGTFKPADSLRAMLIGVGAAPGDTVVTYCHIGQQASLAWFTARMLGYQARLYDGSFQDWSARRELPVVAPAAVTRDSLLVSAGWLKDHLADVVVLHVDRARAGYDSAHVPGARFVQLSEFVVNQGDIGTELPPLDQLVRLANRLGIRNDSRVVLAGDPIAAARLFFTLDFLGHGDRATLLDGGLAAWRAAGGTVTSEGPTVTASQYQPRPWPDLAIPAAQVRARLADPGTAILDARAAAEFQGERPDTTLPRQGHIAGAQNLDWRTTMTEGRLKPAAELRAMFEAAGASPQDEVITYCGVGLRASMLYFVSRYLGYRTRLYDGSLAEWSRIADAPMEKGG